MRKRRHLIGVSLFVIVGAVVTYFLLTTIYKLPPAASEEAVPIDNMFRVYFGLIAFMFSLIMVFMLYAVFVFRRKPGDAEDAAHVHGNTVLEVTWTILPFALVIGLGTWGASTLSALTKEKTNEMVIKVTGQQWAWSFEYPDLGGFTSRELALPVGQPVLLEMQSRDVLHSFWVPEFRVKQDLLPGRTTTLRITPSVIDDYKLRCAEICGLNHTEMRADVRVMAAADFDAWVQQSTAAPVYAELTPEERGAQWYLGGEGDFTPCSGCHTIDGTPGAGPTWLGLFGRQETLSDGTTVIADEAYIRNSILQPGSQMLQGFQNVMPPTFEQAFTEKQAEILSREGVEIDIIDDLIAYIKTLEE